MCIYSANCCKLLQMFGGLQTAFWGEPHSLNNHSLPPTDASCATTAQRSVKLGTDD